VDDHDAGSFGGAKRVRDKIAARPILADLEIIEYLEFVLSYSTMKEPLIVLATVSKRLHILPIIVRRFLYLLVLRCPKIVL